MWGCARGVKGEESAQGGTQTHDELCLHAQMHRELDTCLEVAGLGSLVELPHPVVNNNNNVREVSLKCKTHVLEGEVAVVTQISTCVAVRKSLLDFVTSYSGRTLLDLSSLLIHYLYVSGHDQGITGPRPNHSAALHFA